VTIFDSVQRKTPLARRGWVRTSDLSRVKGDDEGADLRVNPVDKPDSGEAGYGRSGSIAVASGPSCFLAPIPSSAGRLFAAVRDATPAAGERRRRELAVLSLADASSILVTSPFQMSTRSWSGRAAEAGS
jgi:hypothetical protein